MYLLQVVGSTITQRFTPKSSAPLWWLSRPLLYRNTAVPEVTIWLVGLHRRTQCRRGTRHATPRHVRQRRAVPRSGTRLKNELAPARSLRVAEPSAAQSDPGPGAEERAVEGRGGEGSDSSAETLLGDQHNRALRKLPRRLVGAPDLYRGTMIVCGGHYSHLAPRDAYLLRRGLSRYASS